MTVHSLNEARQRRGKPPSYSIDQHTADKATLLLCLDGEFEASDKIHEIVNQTGKGRRYAISHWLAGKLWQAGVTVDEEDAASDSKAGDTAG